MDAIQERDETAAKLLGSLTEFTKFFLKYITQRDYIESRPVSREPHMITIYRELTALTRMQHNGENLMINIPPGSGKTLSVCMWIAWCMAQYPDSNFIYISYSHSLASKHTAFIKRIMTSDLYEYLFGVKISSDSRAKDHFSTEAGGFVAAFGSSGSITGRDAGLPNLDRFSGAVIIDDPHKPDDAHSDVKRESVISNYEETIRQRPRGKNVPIVFIGQRVHEADLAAFLMSGKDVKPWRQIIMKGLDDAENALYPEVHSKDYLIDLREKSPYVFASQYQQDPLPAGGAVFKPEWIEQTEEYPYITETFITADTAETSKNYNDATVFSFWGVYEIESFGRKTGQLGLHSIDCVELRVEPKDLRDCFLDFWAEGNRFTVPPRMAAIEKKSTGTTLLSVLKDIRGIVIKDIPRNANSGSKSDRFLRSQYYVAGKFVSINENAKHKDMFLSHLSKITANDTHRFDDIADTLADAIQLVFIEKQVGSISDVALGEAKKMEALRANMLKQINRRSGTHG
jgi:predicted phage terminase large subunit-like protein